MPERKTTDTWLQLRAGVLDVAAADDFLRAVEAGGVCLFTGITRRAGTDDRPTERLDFEAYEAMALSEMEHVAEAARTQWPDVEHLVLLHRTGAVPLTEASVVTGASAPHRAEAFAACRFLIDTLKEQVPIWKREVYTDGQAEWKRGGAPKSASQGEGTP